MSKAELNQDFFELGDRTSIICADPATTEIVRNSLKDLGFKMHFADSEDGALDRIRYTQYNCIVIHEKADDEVSDPAGNAGARLACGVIKKM
jgi:Cu-Zn family superoxide dismutase